MGQLLSAALAVPSPEATAREALDASVAGGPIDQAVEPLANELGITEIMHFTTNRGLVGILRLREVLCRTRLPSEKLLQYVYQPNAEIRKDPEWLPFVNLSISQVNDWMLDCSTRWHRDDEELFWVVLSFTPEILSDPGVVFTTTNNIYPAVKRAAGAPGLAALFAPVVKGRYGYMHQRMGLADHQPTSRQAEVLYPDAVTVDHLRHVYVRFDEHLDAVDGIFGGISGDEVPVTCAPEVFT